MHLMLAQHKKLLNASPRVGAAQDAAQRLTSCSLLFCVVAPSRAAMVWARVLRCGLDDMYGAAIPIHPCANSGNDFRVKHTAYKDEVQGAGGVKRTLKTETLGVEQVKQMVAHWRTTKVKQTKEVFAAAPLIIAGVQFENAKALCARVAAIAERCASRDVATCAAGAVLLYALLRRRGRRPTKSPLRCASCRGMAGRNGFGSARWGSCSRTRGASCPGTMRRRPRCWRALG